MKYAQLLPPASISKYVRYFWVLENDTSTKSFNMLSPLADGCPGIFFQHSSAGTFYDASNRILPEVYLYGQTITPIEFYIRGNFKTLGVCFYPYALKSIYGLNASELTDNCLDITLLTAQLRDELVNANSTRRQIEIFVSYIAEEIKQKNPTLDGETEYALRQLITSKGIVSLKSLQQKLNLSERSLERKFSQQIGISPKLFSKVCQFQASLHQLRQNNYTTLSDIAYDNGFADQSHFIRTFKTFAGISPLQFQKGGRKSTENFSLL
jgi:AraC-like DNA-binding protein